jgi:hypothetical protein
MGTTIYIPHEAVYVEMEGHGFFCVTCGKQESVHPEYYDQDVPLDDEEEERG